MAVITAFGINNEVLSPQPNPNISDQLNEYARYIFPGFVSVATVSSTAGVLTQVDNSPSPNVIQSFRAITFHNDYYEDIHIIPESIDLGVVSTNQVRFFNVFNAYTRSQDLTSITKQDLDGINLVGPITKTFNQFEETQYTVNVLTDGPVTIDGFFNFDWAIVQDMSLPVEGSRAVLFPFLMQLNTLERLSWFSQVITSENGTEQRIKIREAPRQSFEVNINVSKENNAYLDNLLYGWRDKVYVFPVSSECQKTIAATATDSPDIFVETRYSDFRVGEIAIIYSNPRNFDLFQIESISQIALTANRNISKVFPIGSLVMPAKNCMMVNNPTRSLNGYRSSVSVSFEVLDNFEISSNAVPEFTYTHNSVVEDVYVDQQLTVDEFSPEVYQAKIESLDYAPSKVAFFSSWTNNKPNRSYRVELKSLIEVWNFRQWLHRRNGRVRPFWLPTYESNFRLIQSIGNIDSTLIVKDDGQRTLTGNRKVIAFKFKTGVQWEFRNIDSINESGENLSVVMTTSLGRDANELEFISYMDRKRLNSDTIEIQWIGNSVATAVIPAINTD